VTEETAMNANVFFRKRALLAIGMLALVLGAENAAAISREVQGSTRTSVNRSANVDANANRSVNANRNTNVNVNRNVNVDVDRDYGYDRDYHPVATAAAVATTAAIVGSMVNTLPPSCTMTVVNGVTYQNCGGTWYQPQYAGTSVQYVVVNAPQ
jgi:hypothetical protein